MPANPRQGVTLYHGPVLGMLVQGSAGGSGSPACNSSMEMAVRRADEGHATVTRRAVDRHAVGDKGAAGVVNVVHGVCEMPEIAAAGVGLGIPVVGELHGSFLVAWGGEEHVGVAAFLVRMAADLAQTEHREEGDGVLQRADADHGMQVFGHEVSS